VVGGVFSRRPLVVHVAVKNAAQLQVSIHGPLDAWLLALSSVLPMCSESAPNIPRLSEPEWSATATSLNAKAPKFRWETGAEYVHEARRIISAAQEAGAATTQLLMICSTYVPLLILATSISKGSISEFCMLQSYFAAGVFLRVAD
jgi:hypothetical protein